MVKTENINKAETDKAETDKAETDKNQKSKLAVILFTRVPIPGQTKTRLSPMLSADSIARLHAAFTKDIAEEILTHSWAEGSPDLFIAAHPFDQVEMLQNLLKEALPNNGPAIQYIPQVGADIGEKMKNAMAQVLELGYDYASLIGSDIPRLKAQHLEESFASRDAFDVSIGPSLDGGYFLVGMKALVPQFFENNSYSTQSALQEAQTNLDKTGKSHTLISRCPDMDSPEDLIRLYSEIRNEAQAEALIPILTESTTLAKMPNTRSFLATDKEFLAKIYLWQSPLYMALGLTQKEMRGAEIGFLAQGEYHLNYSFVHPKKGKKLVLRINTGSQLHLKNQIVYEYTALKALESSGRTPKPIYVDDTKSLIPHGVLVMDFLKGRMLDYQKDLNLAAACLAEIHKTKVDSALFIAPQNVAETVLKECEQMIQTFEQAEFAPQSGKNKIRALLQKGWALPRLDSPYNCCINTELNNTNFIVDGDFCSLVDWEKPLFGDPAQDLAHFLAPTTTLWKTEILLSKKEMRDFVSVYIDHVQGVFSTQNLMERVDQYIRIQCLRGICWCAMAWVLYQEEGKMLLNESTRKKLEMYISDEFLDKINGLF